MSIRRSLESVRPRTLAAKFLLVVVFGAVLPLALVGLWLTRSAERSGTRLLRTQLENAADVLVTGIERRWALRDGELQLLLNNSAARNALMNASISAVDSVYLGQLGNSVGGAIPFIAYVDVTGRERWSFVSPAVRTSLPLEQHAWSRPDAPSSELRVEIPILSDGGPIGTLRARVRLASVLSTDSTGVLVPGATLTITGHGGAVWSSAPNGFEVAEATLPPGWEVVRRTPRNAPMQLALAAESAPYVTPFEHAARTGLGLLMSVALVALMVSIALTTRMTRSLERLSEAAGAVAGGNLDRSVHESNDDEIGRLATAFNAMTESLRRTLAELSQQRALAAVGEFAATLSHEVRNALTAIRVDLQHARRHLPVDNVGTSLVTRTLESVRRLDSTVTSALRVARSGQIAMSRVDLGPVLLRAMQAAESSFTERGATLEPLANPIEDVMVIGDGAALEQLFMNLLLNAGQALTAGGRAHLEWERANGSVVVKVIDTGGGIAEEKLQLLGQPFQSSKPYGTGLGLPIARRIAAAHGGELLLESDGQVGTSAIVRLPLVDPRQ